MCKIGVISDRVYLCVVMLSSFVCFCDLAAQAEQRRILQGEFSGQSRLLQRIEGILLPAAAHRECRGHEAPTQHRKWSFVLVCKKKKKGGCYNALGEELSRWGVVINACLSATSPSTCFIPPPDHRQFSISCCRAELLTVNTAHAPPTKPLKRLWSFIHRPPPYAPSQYINQGVVTRPQPGCTDMH